MLTIWLSKKHVATISKYIDQWNILVLLSVFIISFHLTFQGIWLARRWVEFTPQFNWDKLSRLLFLPGW